MGIAAALVLAVSLFAHGLEASAAAAPPAGEVVAVDASTPGELAAAVGEALAGGGALRVSVGGEPLAEFWLNGSLAVAGEGGSSGLGVAYPGLPKGGLVGAIRILRTWTDYRGSRVDPGAYTLRYAVEPADGAHMGVSFYRDFLLLVPAAADDGRAAWTADELIAASRRSTGGSHPAVLALFPPPAAEGALPPHLAANELGQPILVARAGEATLGLVLAGQGDLPEGN